MGIANGKVQRAAIRQDGAHDGIGGVEIFFEGDGGHEQGIAVGVEPFAAGSFGGEHFIDVLASVGPYLRRIKLTPLDVARVRKNPQLLAELAERIAQDSHAESEREVLAY